MQFEKEPGYYEKSPFIYRGEELLQKNGTTYYGKIVIDFYQCGETTFSKMLNRN